MIQLLPVVTHQGITAMVDMVSPGEQIPYHHDSYYSSPRSQVDKPLDQRVKELESIVEQLQRELELLKFRR